MRRLPGQHPIVQQRVAQLRGQIHDMPRGEVPEVLEPCRGRLQVLANFPQDGQADLVDPKRGEATDVLGVW